MRTMIRGGCTSEKEVTSGVPQGSIVGPVLFLGHVKDITKGVRSCVSMSADGTRLTAETGDMKNCETLLGDVDAPPAWEQKWMMNLIQNECPLLRLGRGSGHPRGNYSQLGRV